MSARDDGGPAFPAPAEPRTDLRLEDVTSGMSLRDWFAGQALVGLAAHDAASASGLPDDAGRYAYRIADAMLAARKEPR